MYKNYDTRKDQQLRVFGKPEDTYQIEKRTKAFIQWVVFNKRDPAKMARAILHQPQMHFLVNCKMIIDDTVRCEGKTYKFYSYGWSDRYFPIINQARKLFWAYQGRKEE